MDLVSSQWSGRVDGRTEGRQKREERREKRERRGKWKITSIFRPSTSVPWSFSLAFSASALFSNVTKPKPCGTQQREKSRMKTQGHVIKDWLVVEKHLPGTSYQCFLASITARPTSTYLWTPLIEYNLYIQNLPKLLQKNIKANKLEKIETHNGVISCLNLILFWSQSGTMKNAAFAHQGSLLHQRQIPAFHLFISIVFLFFFYPFLT